MYNLWSDILSFPKYEEMSKIKGIDYINVHTAIKGEYQFLLGAAIVKHHGRWHASWGNSFRNENDDNTILAEKYSYDNGKTWADYRRISKVDEGFGRSHGVFFVHMNKLYAFCPKAKYNKVDAYPNLMMEAYVLNDHNEWECLGIVLDEDFWPLCEPIWLDNGTLLMAGLKTDTAEAAIALCDGRNLTKWVMKIIPNPQDFKYWGETTVLKREDKLVAIVRGGKEHEYALVSESFDHGNSWTGLEKSNLPIVQSKMYAGTLTNGKNYLIFNARTGAGGPIGRGTMCIATGNEQFDKVYVIRHGFEAPPLFWTHNEWSYPYACEDKENRKLYVVYAKNKEDCELAVIPLENIEK